MSKKKKQAKSVSGEERQSTSSAEPPLQYPSRDLALRFIDVLERQLQAKDEQLRLMDARLQDAYDMQRALALIIRQFEQRTGLSSDVLWDQIPEEELRRPQGSTYGSVAREGAPAQTPVAEASGQSVTDQDSSSPQPHPSPAPPSQAGPAGPAAPAPPAEPAAPPVADTLGRATYTPQDPPRTFEDWLAQRP
jgi:hypothetical protein